MPLNFPDNPQQNDTFTVNGRTYTYLGNRWRRTKAKVAAVSPTLDVANDFTAGGALHVDSDSGRVGIGTANPQYELHVDGVGEVTGDFQVGQNLDVTGTVDINGLRLTSDGSNISLSEVLAGTYTTQAATTNDDTLATTAFVQSAIANLVDSAPGTLNTLNELAAALDDDPNFATTVTNSIALKLDSSAYTAADVLAKIKTVDGSNSGLDADTLDGSHASAFATSGHTHSYAATSHTHSYLSTSGGTISGSLTVTDRIYPQNWIEFSEYEGLYSPLNGAHFYPNNASYGSWRVAGTRNSWQGLEFDTSNGQFTLMMTAGGNNHTGVHHNGVGWKWYFISQDLYCNAYRGFNNVAGTGNASYHPSGIYSTGTNWLYGTIYTNNSAIYAGPVYDYGTRVSKEGHGHSGGMNGWDAGAGLTYPSATVGGGTANIIGFRWNNPYIKGTVDNVLSVTVGTASDARLKKNIETLSNGIDLVRSLRPVTFNPLDIEEFKEDGSFVVGDAEKDTVIGFIADEVQEVIPSAVTAMGLDLKSIEIDQVVSAVVSAIQSIDARLFALEVTNA